jgi:hypothetical protein
MVSSADFQVFAKYKAAGVHAFSNNVVTSEDKDKYQELFSSLRDAAAGAITESAQHEHYKARDARFYRDGGVQGHRPVDLWAAVVNVESEVLAGYPQVYAIASEAGVELGFAVAIHESDYYNAEIKRRNRTIVPVLYSKLPSPDSSIIKELDQRLLADEGWLIGLKTRQGAQGSFRSLGELIRFLKSGESSAQGGGSIYRIISSELFDDTQFDLTAKFAHALSMFTPLMRALIPSGSEQTRLTEQEVLEDTASSIPIFDPSNIQDGRSKILQAIAVRRGQTKFREKLLDAYGSKCAITGTNVAVTLQAAHIVPYKGPDTNSVQNGILLRADIHNLFDLGLLTIDPETHVIGIVEELRDTIFAPLEGSKLTLPHKISHHPSKAALVERQKMFS